ncbi:MAG: hypothetical protein RML94_11780, partial [Bacteroidia bacterium]|nr:hypothetical protein [Bacteroidia bacterium]
PFLKKAVEVYDDTKEKLAEFLAKEMSLDKSYQTHEDIQKVLEIALDPANILGVGSGLIFESIKELIKAHK